MFGLFDPAKPPTVYDPVVIAQTAKAMEIYGGPGLPDPSIDQIQAVASVIGEAASVMQAMAARAMLAMQRGMVDMSDPVIAQALHDLSVVSTRPELVEAALHNVAPIPAAPLAELILNVTRRVMSATAKSQYHITPTNALIDRAAMPVQPTHVVVDKP